MIGAWWMCCGVNARWWCSRKTYNVAVRRYDLTARRAEQRRDSSLRHRPTAQRQGQGCRERTPPGRDHITVAAYRPSECLHGVMVGKYRLHDPVIGFVTATKQVVTIPAGSILSLTIPAYNSPGICTVVCNGTPIKAFRRDVERNGSMISQTRRCVF